MLSMTSSNKWNLKTSEVLLMKSLFKIAITTSSIFIAVGFMVENVNAVTLGEIEENRDEFSWSFDYNSLERGLGSTIGTVNFTPFKSDFWQVSLTASRNLTDNTIQLLTVNAQHTSKPPGDDHDLDSGTGNSVSFNLSGSNTQTSAIHPSGETTGGHNDLYTFFFHQVLQILHLRLQENMKLNPSLSPSLSLAQE
jgi:hypothetical protein